MHMPLGAPVIALSKYAPAPRRPGAPVKIVWSVEEDQQLLQVHCMVQIGHACIHDVLQSTEGAAHCVVYCIPSSEPHLPSLPPPLGSWCIRSARVGRPSPRSFLGALESSAENGASHSALLTYYIAHYE